MSDNHSATEDAFGSASHTEPVNPYATLASEAFDNPESRFGENIEEEPNAKAKRFYDILVAAKNPIYDGCKEGHSQLSLAARLMSLKTDYNLSQNCMDAICEMMQEYLPEGLYKGLQVLCESKYPCVLFLSMDMDLNIAIQKMSISDDKPLVLPNQAKFCSTEKNHCSIMGRFLNPTNQRMSNWILDMPRIWRLNNRVHGVALSQERFQFIFKSEGDLIEILKTGVWTQDDWCVVMERWIERPPPDYLMFLSIWIRLRNIPVNYYTEETIREIAKCAGEVIQVLFDPEKSQAQDYVRVNVLLDVRNPLRNSKELQLPTGEIVLISFDYERIRKRCFHCQRLTHEKNMCPFLKSDDVSVSSPTPENKDKKKGLLLPDSANPISNQNSPKLLADAMKEVSSQKQLRLLKLNDDESFSGFQGSDFFKGLKEGSSDAGSSGLSLRQKNPRKRKAPIAKTQQAKSVLSEAKKVSISEKKPQFNKVFKRKTQIQESQTSKSLKIDNSTVVPDEPPLYQISALGVNRKEPWCMIGDFNDMLSNKDKLGGPLRLLSSFRPFKDMLNTCDMHELGSTGNSFTWGGKRNYQWIQCKLDRCFGNSAWFSMFPNSHQWFLEKLGSDHRPVLVKFIKDQELFRGQFRFDKRMADNPLLWNAIHSSWNSEISKGKHSSIFSIAQCRRVIHDWKQSSEYNAKNKIQRLRKELDYQMSLQFPCWERIRMLKEQLGIAFHEEESFWRQKSSEKWLLDGDKNTEFFHAAVKSKRVRNALNVLLDDNGIEHSLNREKGQLASRFFEKLFQSSNPCNVNDYLGDLQPRVSVSMNSELTKEVTEQEIYRAVFSINSESAPGPDGFTALFFQKYWSLVKTQVISEIQGFFKTGVLPEEWNHTHICLIPKIPNPTKMTEVRPISLCSVLYKIISKILSSRLKTQLPFIVSSTQSAYVEKRLVSDNILIAHEIMHSLRTNEKMSLDFMVFKTDMSKAFDRVEWTFLEGILTALGFDSKWISWIMGCVSSVTYSVLINGTPYGFIKPERGIRQGDPLSPFLFVLCTEALIHILEQAKRENKVEGIQFNNAGPSINHILFADDTLLMCKANKEECEEILLCLSKYERLSGQMINLDKSAITFGINVNPEIKNWVKMRSGIKTEGGTGKYLGLPECLSGSKQQLLGFIKDRLQTRMSSWFAKTLSQGGKEILLKSIAMALPVYAMTCFKLPISLCKSLTSIMMNFWWNNLQDTRKIHWLSWQKLTMPKMLGGIGFRDLQIFNQALLAKQAWRLLHDKDSLFFKVFKSRYFQNSDFLNAPFGTRPSYAWRSILHGRSLLKEGLKRVIGNGANTNVWIDDWIFDEKPRRALALHSLLNINLTVQSLIDSDTRNWNWDRLKELFPLEEIEIISRQRPAVSQKDSFCWSKTRHGLYTVKSGYELSSRKVHHNLFKEAETEPSLSPLFMQVWKIQTAPKIKVFIWKALKGALAVEERLKTRGIFAKDGCLMCDEDTETVNHILFQCPLARQVWALSNIPFPVHGFGNSIFTNINHLVQISQVKTFPQDIRFVNPWILWILWKNRNKTMFEGQSDWTTKIVAKAFEDGNNWWVAHHNESHLIGVQKPNPNHSWTPPISGELKCNIGFAFSRKRALSGAAWVVRDSSGIVLLHSRRAYTQVHSLFEAKVKSWHWALESMSWHNLQHVTFGASSFEIIQALTNLKDWPAITGHIAELLSFTKDKPNWFALMEDPAANRPAFEIANSVLTVFLSPKMADELWNELQDSMLGLDDPEIFIPYYAYAEAVTRNRLSLIARPLNPRVQNLQTVVSSLPRSWGLATRVHGRVLDATYVQFLFQSEIDLLSIQRREPWVFNNWFVAMQRWEDIPDIDFLTTIDLWVQFRGIPLPYVSNMTVRLIAEVLGEFVETEFNETTSTQVSFIRVRIRFEITDSLRFFSRFSFRSGETAIIRFQYERLRRLCSNCFRMTHHREFCPFLPRIPVNRVNAPESERIGHFRDGLNDEFHRSDMNSQSQNSDLSFPAPISQYPRAVTPPPRVNRPSLNTEELEAACPHFQSSSFQNVRHLDRPIPQYPSRRYSSDGSSSSSHSVNEAISPISKQFEVGESCKDSDFTAMQHESDDPIVPADSLQVESLTYQHGQAEDLDDIEEQEFGSDDELDGFSDFELTDAEGEDPAERMDYPKEFIAIGKSIMLEKGNYGHWKVKMRALIRGLEKEAWIATSVGWKPPVTKDYSSNPKQLPVVTTGCAHPSASCSNNRLCASVILKQRPAITAGCAHPSVCASFRPKLCVSFKSKNYMHLQSPPF
ncbi:Zinc knuckle CX2CX4HX4C [Arabidopsis suecica]|uniref:Zinc knuckle CX2CX4HX4C n=1 Tax=Arabidopsis suecica TaxID=45249 RepID=A0A8T1ZDD6_ARASU|nr:Zinc knuckle CX2CX4HX4C [Arabidopsis suecica]